MMASFDRRKVASARRRPQARVGARRRALGRSGGTELLDVTICHPLSQARIRDMVENPLNLLKKAWTANVSR